MAAAVGVHDEHAGLFAGLLDHVGQVMTVIAGQGGAEDDQVERSLAQGLLDGFAAGGLVNGVSGFFDVGGLAGQDFCVAFAVENRQFC